MKKQLFEKFEQFRMKVLVVLREKEYITLSMLLSV
ncbi:unknown [Prevotella sp. CAG:1031]|nr:unknown [Prevotella sp. CAG:1031]